MCGAVVFVEIQFGYHSFLLGDLFHKISLSFVRFSGSGAGKSGLKFESEAVNDVSVIHGFSVSCKAEFTGSGYFSWSERLPSALKW